MTKLLVVLATLLILSFLVASYGQAERSTKNINSLISSFISKATSTLSKDGAREKQIDEVKKKVDDKKEIEQGN